MWWPFSKKKDLPEKDPSALLDPMDRTEIDAPGPSNLSQNQPEEAFVLPHTLDPDKEDPQLEKRSFAFSDVLGDLNEDELPSLQTTELMPEENFYAPVVTVDISAEEPWGSGSNGNPGSNPSFAPPDAFAEESWSVTSSEDPERSLISEDPVEEKPWILAGDENQILNPPLVSGSKDDAFSAVGAAYETDTPLSVEGEQDDDASNPFEEVENISAFLEANRDFSSLAFDDRVHALAPTGEGSVFPSPIAENIGNVIDAPEGFSPTALEDAIMNPMNGVHAPEESIPSAAFGQDPATPAVLVDTHNEDLSPSASAMFAPPDETSGQPDYTAMTPEEFLAAVSEGRIHVDLEAKSRILIDLARASKAEESSL